MPSDAISNPLTQLTKPGLHSYNIQRKMGLGPKPPRSKGSWIRLALLLIGIGCMGYYGFTLGNEYLYQAYENWAFDQDIAGRPATVRDWIMQATPLGQWTGYHVPPAATAQPVQAPSTSAENVPALPEPLEGDLLGRIEIPRLKLSSIVRQGVSQSTLSRAVGHVPSTQAAGAVGNFAIAAHRDTLFRALKDILTGDTVTFRSAQEEYKYEVVSTKIVKPSDVSVLRPEGSQKLLTMITCYPFYYVGSAPKRFIVTARLVSQTAASKEVAASSGLHQ